MITQKHPKCSALLPTQKNVEKEEEIILPHNSPFSSFSLFLYLSKYLRGQTLSLSPSLPRTSTHFFAPSLFCTPLSLSPRFPSLSLSFSEEYYVDGERSASRSERCCMVSFFGVSVCSVFGGQRRPTSLRLQFQTLFLTHLSLG
jgi:hypothetical protein